VAEEEEKVLSYKISKKEGEPKSTFKMAPSYVVTRINEAYVSQHHQSPKRQESLLLILGVLKLELSFMTVDAPHAWW
jgi:hypothetical protein